MKDKRIEYYDSLSTSPDKRAFEVRPLNHPSQLALTIFPNKVLREYLQKEHMDKKKKPIDLSDWEDYYDPVSKQRACVMFH